MKIAEVIRNILDVLDAIEQYDQTGAEQLSGKLPHDPEVAVRNRQIADLRDDGNKQYPNSPNAQYADIEALTATGNDVNKSKHPADIRTNAPSMYPGYQHRVGE